MENSLVLAINIAAILVMLYCLGSVIVLGKELPGGIVGKQWRTLKLLVVLFTIGYFITPFFGQIPPASINIIVALIFLFGAFYVLITIRLIYRIIAELAG